MLLKTGVAMMLFSVALAAVAVVVVNLSGLGGTATLEAPAQEAPAQEKAGGTAASPGDSGEREAGTLPVSRNDWPQPTREEVSAADGPRYYPPNGNADLSLTVEAIGLYGVPIITGEGEEALEAGAIHLPQTPFPWEEREQKNVYIAGHRLGYANTGSRLVFYNLDKLEDGDAIILEDREGNVYEYRVSEVFVVDPNADWAVDPVRGRDIVTLQTCTTPNFENRLVVRADRVGVPQQA